MVDPTSFQSIRDIGEGQKEYVADRGTIAIDLYLFDASYEDQMDVEINIDKKVIDNRGFDVELDGEISEITGSLEVARFIAEIYGRVPGIFRECVKELWILDIDSGKWDFGN